MTVRLPTIGSDTNSWGTILNQFLQVGHNANGSLNSVMSVYNLANDFGADPTGAADSTTAITNAATAAGNAGGGILYGSPGTYKHTGIVLPNRVFLTGAGPRSTVYKLANGANTHSIKNFVSPDNIVANAEFCGVMNCMLDGNKANQSGTSHGIFFTSAPTGSAATNDDDFDTHQLVQNVFIYNALTDGFNAASRSGMQLHNVQAYFCDHYGFTPSYDTELIGCVAGQSGVYGFNLAQASLRLTNCKSFYAGRITASLGYGFYINGGTYSVNLAACEAQDNKASGYVLDTSDRCTLVGCVADSNSTSSAGTYPALDFWQTTNSIVEGFIAFERKADGTNSWQTQALRMRSSSTKNRISLAHSAAGGATIAAPIMSSSNSLAGNDVRINSQAAFQTITYAASITPDPFVGNVVEVTLTGALTINAPGNGPYVPGTTLTFILIQDGTGGRVTTFNAAYKTNWTPVTTASKTNTISFAYDGTSWWQQSATTGM